jgi:hypothetical protein
METPPLFDLPENQSPEPPAPRPATPTPGAAAPQGPMMPPTHLDTAVAKLAEAVTGAWFAHHISGRIELPLSALAAVAFLAPDSEHVRPATQEMLAWDTNHTMQFARNKWREFAQVRPDLVNPAAPFLIAWLGSTPLTTKEEQAVHDVVRAALRADLFALTLPDARYNVDLFGHTLTLLKAGKAVKAGSAHYTPADVCELITRTMGPPTGDSVFEEASGTGGLIRVAAARLREQGRDPHDVAWGAADVEEMAIACLAANVVVWDLGHHVLLGVADALGRDWIPQAQAMRAETIALAREVAHARPFLDASQALMNPTPEGGHTQRARPLTEKENQ